MNYRFILLLLLLFCSYMVSAQKTLKIAEKAYKAGDYYMAVEYFEAAFKDKQFEKYKSKADYYFKYAESCRFSHNFSKAEAYYKKVFDSSENISKFKTLDFWYAYTLKHNAKYQEAKNEFEKFISQAATTKENAELKRMAMQEIKSCSLALEIYQRPIEGVSVENVGDNVNTKFSDFAPHLVDGDLYYSSLKFEAQAQRRAGIDDPTEKHLYGKLMVAREGAKKKGSLLPNLNQKYQNIGNSSISPDGKRLYYTVCDKDADFEFICKLYVAERSGKNSNWSKGKELNFNSKKGTNTHPNVSFDSTLNKEVIYFASSRDGGFGEMDIYYVTYEGNAKYGEVVNLGNLINTEGKEATPFFHQASQTLYFSSTWHPGLGGFDIFKSKRENGKWTEPVNVGVPLNSAANDLYFFISPQVDTFGYFSSNRPGSKILTGESCCNDIYALVLPAKIEPGKPIDLLVSVEPDTTKLSNPQSEIIVNTILNPEPEEIEINSEPELQPEPEVLVQNNTEVFEPNVELISEDKPIVELSFNEIEKMLPLTIYFHNDEPDSNTLAITTKTNYTEAYNSFMNLKDIYIAEFSSQFIDIEKRISAAERIRTFFDNTVSVEYKRLNDFMAQLLIQMEKGESIEVSVRGFCSSRSTSSYNLNLARRRISCLKNQLNSYRNGVLSKYIASGKIKIVDLPIGETQTPSGVSDDVNDPRNSIYSPDASAQRKVHIELIKKR